MNNEQFTQKVESTINKSKSDNNGNVKGVYRLQESKSGGVNFQFAEKTIKSFIDGERRHMLQDGISQSFLSVSEMLSTKEKIEDVIYPRFAGKDGYIWIYEPNGKQNRINSLSRRIVKAYAKMFGLNADTLKGLNLSGPQCLRIVKASASFFVRNTQKYVAVSPKVVKKSKPVSTPKTKTVNAPQENQQSATV
jgi:hypothetical protein